MTSRAVSIRRTGFAAFAFAMLMLGMGFAAVPLYRIFCQVTGFGGTTMRVDEAKAATIPVLNKTISVRFNANVAREMPWTFSPEQVTQTVRIGQRTMAFYKSRNNAPYPVTGVATFNVSPDRVGKYFSKVHCFCFNQQTLQPGQEVDMPVQYFVDPAILQDEETKDIEQITLSYTFHLSNDQPAKALDQGGAAR